MTMDCGNSFPKQEVRPGGSTTKPIHVVVTESMSVFNQRALVSHGQESRAPHVSNQQQKPTSKCSLSAGLPLFHRPS